MPERYELELSTPSLAHCSCCGGLTVRLTRFVYRSGEAFAVYYVAYSNSHPDNEVWVLVSLGEWGEDSEPAQRTAFFCRVRPTDDSYGVMLDDAADSPWADVELVGERLSRRRALVHPWKDTALEVLDEAFEQDPSLKGFLGRVQCGDASVPLERTFGAPDDIFALGKAAKRRAKVGRAFATLDEQRFFVRCLLPLSVAHYDAWNIGVWVEVSGADWKRIRHVWDEPEYAQLQFEGEVANDLEKDLGLPAPVGTRVGLHVTDADAPPFVKGPRRGALGRLLNERWTRRRFESFAVARGFL